MRKGIILEINDLYLTLLTPEGEFLRTRKLQHDYQVGEEIHFFPEMADAKRKKFNLSFLNSFKARTISLAAAFMLIMTAFIPIYQGGEVYAYMSIDVNPSIEMAVSDELKVLRLKGYNHEGEEIIEDITGWKKKDAADVAEMIIDNIEEKGFFTENKDVVIATVRNGKVKESAELKLDKKISEIKKATQEEKLKLKVMQGTSEDRKKAKKQGLTTGLYKEKQIEKANPAATPANEKQPLKPEAGQKQPATPLKQQPQPKKQENPNQNKKRIPETPKAENAKTTTPSSDKNKDRSNESKSKKQSQNGGQGKLDNDSNGKKIAKIASSQKTNLKKTNGKNNSNKHQQKNKKENNGYSNKNNARHDKK